MTALSRWVLVGLAVMLALALAVAGTWYYRDVSRTIREHEATKLAAIARLKVDRIARWREERMGDARLNATGLIRAHILAGLNGDDGPTRRDACLARLEELRRSYGYQAALLVAPSGRVLLSTDPNVEDVSPETFRLTARARLTGAATIGDLFRCELCGQVHLDVAAPIRDESGRAVATLVLRTDPETLLFPLIRDWPTPSPTAETLLVRPDGDDMLFLNVLRHRPNEPALTRRLPRTDSDVPAVAAAAGRIGRFEGRDYRGVDVLAYVLPVPDSGWFMIAKVDQGEVLAEARYRGKVALILVVVAILASWLMLALVYRTRRHTAAERLLSAERERAKNQEEARVTLYSIGDGVIATDAAGRVTRMNPVAAALTGWPEAEAIGRPLAEAFHIVHETSRAEVTNPAERVLRDGAIVGLANHTMLIARDGTERPIADSGAPIRDDQGEMIGVVLVFRDQSDERAAEQRLRESDERYRALFDRSRDCIYLHDLQGRFLDANEATLELFGYSRQDIPTLDFTSILPADQLPRAWATLQELISTGQQRDGADLRIRAKDGSLRHVETRSGLVLRDGQVVAVQGIARDLTERDRAEAERAQLEEQLVQVRKLESIGRLAGGVAHDFNNLLAVVLSYTGLALDGLREGDPLRDDLLEIKKAGEHGAALTRQLLAFGRKQVLQLVPLDLEGVVAGLEGMLRRLLGEHIVLSRRTAPDLGLTMADPNQIEQVLMNLLLNARDAMPDGGELTVELSNADLDEAAAAQVADATPGPQVRMAVADTGGGMDEETRTHLFEPFFTTKGRGKGTGLGLATVHGIVKQSGGHISVTSELGRGTTFEVYLPRAPATATQASRSHRVVRTTGGSETILVVEDEDALRRLVVRVLGGAGYEVLTAANGGEALLRCEQHPGEIDLVLTDVIMPKMSGRELAERLAVIRPGLRVLFMSGYPDEQIAHHGVLEPGTWFIGKPFSPATLRQKVREFLDHGGGDAEGST